MKTPSRIPLSKFLTKVLKVVPLMCLTCASSSHATTLTWDAVPGTTGPQDGAGTWNVSNSNWWDGSSDVPWANTTSDTAIFGAGSGATGTVTVSGTVIANAITFNTPGSGNYSLLGGTISLGGTTPTITQNVNNGGGATINSVLAGSAGLATNVSSSAGTAGLSLGGVNTYTGVTTIGGIGRTALFNLNALGATGVGNGTVVTSGATVALAVTGVYSAEALTLNGTGTGNAGALRFSTGSTIWTGAITLGSNSSAVGAGSSATLQGNIDLAGFTLSRTGIGTNLGDLWSGNVVSTGGGGSLTFNGNGFTLIGTNTYGGTTTVVAGSKLTISNSTITGSGNQTIANNGLGGSAVVLNGTTGANTLVLKNNGDGTTGAQTLAYGNNVTVSNNGGTTFSVGNTDGTVLNNNTSTSTGATAQNKTLAMGTLNVSNDTAGVANTVSVTGSNGYALAFGATTLSVNTTFNTAADLTLGAVGQSGGTRTLTKTGASTLILSGTNTYDGATTVTAGTLQVGDGNTTGSLSTGSAVIDNSTLAFNRSNTVTQGTDFSGSAITGSGAVIQLGSGTLALNAANTYGGGTTVASGTLRVNNTTGSATGAGAVGVESGATIGGGNTSSGLATTGGASLGNYAGGITGIVSGPLTINSGAHLAPGNSVGTLTAGTLTLNLGAVLDYEFNGTANDFISTTGTDGLTLNGAGFNLYAEGGTTAFGTPGTYNLIGYQGTVNGTGILDLSVLNPQSDLYTYTFVNDTVDHMIQLNIAAVPEPDSWALMVGGLAVLIFWQRRRQTTVR